jgi:hypothetical protein
MLIVDSLDGGRIGIRDETCRVNVPGVINPETIQDVQCLRIDDAKIFGVARFIPHVQ